MNGWLALKIFGGFLDGKFVLDRTTAVNVKHGGNKLIYYEIK